MSVVATMVRRDLRSRLGQVVAMAATIFLGVVLFGASYDAFLNLEASYDSLYQQTGFADFTVSGVSTGAFAERAATETGVQTVETRHVAEIPIEIDGHRLLGRVVGVPTSAALNQIIVLSGRGLDPTDGASVVLEQHVADHFGIEPGDTISLATVQNWAAFRVVGLAASPEYVWPAESRQDVLTPPGEFGVVFASEDLVAQLPGSVDEALVGYQPGADRAAVDARLAGAASDLGLTATTRADQPSNAALQEDVKGFGELSFMFPLLFLGTAGMALYVMLTRLVYSQRSIIGLMRASGFSRRAIMRRYLYQGLAVGGLGGVPGAVAGVFLAGTVSKVYTSAIKVPITSIHFHPATLVEGLAFAVVAGALAALAPARLASRIQPAEAMRGELPMGGVGRRSLLERLIPPLRRLPTRWLMVLRGLGRNRRRTLSTMLGVSLALVLVLSSWGMIDTTQVLLDRQFLQVQKQNAEVVLNTAPDPAVISQLEAVPGVARAESTAVVDTVLHHGPDSYSTVTQAFEQDTTMHTFIAPDGSDLSLPTDGVLVGVALRSLLGVEVGDSITIGFPSLGAGATTRIAGFVDEPLGTFVYASETGLKTLAGDGAIGSALPTALVAFDRGADPDTVIAALQDLSEVQIVRDSHALYETAQSFMGLFYAFVGVMLVFGAVMAFALILSSVAANVSEREVELATLAASGAGRGLLGRLVSAENIALTVIGIPLGLVIGYLVSAAFMSSFSSDLFSFDLHMRATTPLWASLGVLAAALVSLIPATRVVRRLDVAGVVRSRAV
ncbi:MAG: FtsX-like permease family protein [Acidimicrobiia bacterium]